MGKNVSICHKVAGHYARPPKTQTFVKGANIVVKMVGFPVENMACTDLDDGEIGRWLFV